MIERRRIEINVAKQIFKHDEFITFRIYASVHKFPIRISPASNWPIYQLVIQTEDPFACYINGRFVRHFPNWEEAWDILQERVNTKSRQFGFQRDYLWRWKKEQ